MRLSYKTLDEEVKDIPFEQIEVIDKAILIKIDNLHVRLLSIPDIIYILII